jgi:hypothetical protein
MVPFVHLGFGRVFGELALAVTQTNRAPPRAASIWTQEDTVFATLTKADYQQIIAIANQKATDKML